MHRLRSAYVQGEPLDEEEAKRLRNEELKKPGAAQEQLESIGLFVNPDDVRTWEAGSACLHTCKPLLPQLLWGSLRA